MLTPDYIAEIPQRIVELFASVETDLMVSIIKRLLKTHALSGTMVYQLEKLQDLRMLTAEVNRILSTAEKDSKVIITDTMMRAVAESLKADDRIYKAAGLEPPDLERSYAVRKAIKAGVKTAGKLLENLTRTTALATNVAFTNELDKAYLEVLSGAYTGEQAITKCVSELTHQGITKVAYPNGRQDKIDVAVRRAVSTSVSQTTANLQLERAAEMGCDLVETTSHAGARPDHAVWQGQVFCLNGKRGKYEDFVKSTGYGSGDGLCGWNCRHSFYPYLEGVSGHSFMQDPTSLRGKDNDTLYEQTQRQRALERTVRESKRTLVGLAAAINEAPSAEIAAALKADFSRSSVVLKNRERKLKSFCAEVNLPLQPNRTSVTDFGRSVSAKAVAAAKAASK